MTFYAKYQNMEYKNIPTLLTFIVLFIHGGYGAVMSPENQLLQDIMVNYNKNVRPLMNPNDNLVIDTSFAFKKIEKLDEKNQIMTSFGWIAMAWTDELLQWNPFDYNMTYRLVLNAEQVWLPELAMLNSVEQGNDLSLGVKFRVSVLYDGTVFFAPGFKWITECRVNLRYFPFDTQECNVSFTNWVYGTPSLTYSSSGRVNLGNYELNDEWDMLNATSNTELLLVDDEGGMVVPHVYFTIRIKRIPTYYMVNMFAPCFMISIIACMVFMVPSDAGEKVSLAITVMLAYTIVLLMVSDITPKSGVITPYITIFIIISMGQTMLCLITTVLILNIYHHAPNKPVPDCVREIMFGCTASVLCMGSDIKDLKASKVSPGEEILQGKGTMLEDMEKVPEKYMLPDDVLTYIRNLMDKAKDIEQEERYRAEWVALGKVADRLLMYSFLLLTVIEIIVFMMLTYLNKG